VVSSPNSAIQQEVIDAVKRSLVSAPGPQPVLREIAVADYPAHDAPTPDLIVTIGTEAARTVLQKPPATKVFCAFLPEGSYQALVRSTAGGSAERVSALVLDQPFQRRMRLVMLALPQYTRLGVILGPQSRAQKSALLRAARNTGLTLRTEIVNSEKELIASVTRVLDDSDVLFAVPDPLVFNRSTAQSILLTSYRIGKPVVGYSRTYVTAGSLLALHSEPEQIGRQIVDSLRLHAAGGRLPPLQHPRYFSVEINHRVAHSLDLDLPGREQLQQQLAAENGEGAP